MTTEEIENVVYEMAAKTYQVDQAGLSRETVIKQDLGKASLKLVSMISLINDELDILISNRDAMQYVTLGELIDRAIEDYEE